MEIYIWLCRHSSVQTFSIPFIIAFEYSCQKCLCGGKNKCILSLIFLNMSWFSFCIYMYSQGRRKKKNIFITWWRKERRRIVITQSLQQILFLSIFWLWYLVFCSLIYRKMFCCLFFLFFWLLVTKVLGFILFVFRNLSNKYFSL